jgi:hypothetical protein
MINLICSGFFIMLALSGCGWNGTPTRSNDFTPLTSIQIIAVSPAIAAQTSTKLSVTGNFSGLFTRDITDQVVWSSDTPTVATVVSPNRVTAGLVPGTAILTATVGSVSATFTLTVSSATVTAMTITPANPSIAKGLNTQFAVSGTFSDGTTQDLTFDVTWASSNSAVATVVSNAVTSNGLAQTLAAGTSTISATFESISAATLLTVTVPVLQSITVSPANPSILSLSTGSFKSTGTYSDGSTADITSLAAWSSSSSVIATISTGGAAKTVSQGTTTISATLAGVSGTSTLKVTGGNLTGIVLTPTNIRLVRGTSAPLTAIGSFSNGSSRDITGGVVWSVANTTVATVTTPVGNQAWLNALAVASTTVTAQFGAVTAAAISLTVTAPLPQAIAISPTSQDLTVGTSNRFTLTATFNDGTTQDVTASANWTSSDDTAATVGNTGQLANGRVSGVAAFASPVFISAAYGVLTATATVTVRTRTLANLIISGTPAVRVVSGNQVKFTATASYTDGTSKDVTEDTTWTIDNPFVVILADSQSQPGQVVAVDTGSATLTASFGGKTQTVTITVP